MIKHEKNLWGVVLLIVVLGVVSFLGMERGEHCYALRRGSQIQPGQHDYAFLRYQQLGQWVWGTLVSYPYGTDNMTGTIKGRERADETGGPYLDTWYDYMAEGMDDTETRLIRLATPGAYVGYGEMYERPDGRYAYVDRDAIQYSFVIPEVTCETYDQIYAGWQQNR